MTSKLAQKAFAAEVNRQHVRDFYHEVRVLTMWPAAATGWCQDTGHLMIAVCARPAGVPMPALHPEIAPA